MANCRSRIDVLCIVRGMRGNTVLTGKTLVWFPPEERTPEERERSLLNDVAWLHHRNECYYNKLLSASESRSRATLFTKNILAKWTTEDNIA